MQVKTDQLGLAAYIKTQGAALTSVEGRSFIFESETEKREWEVHYAQSAESRFNAELIMLNQLRKKG